MDLRGVAGATLKGVGDVLNNWWTSTGESGNGAKALAPAGVDPLTWTGKRLSFALIILEDSADEGSYVSAGQWPAQWGQP
jgi:hypothetical protein